MMTYSAGALSDDDENPTPSMKGKSVYMEGLLGFLEKPRLMGVMSG